MNITMAKLRDVRVRAAKGIFGTVIATALAFAGSSGALAATDTPSQVQKTSEVSTAPDAPDVAMVWTVYQDNYYTKDSCIQASFWVLYNHSYIKDYQCLENPYGQINAGRWSLWIYVPDAIAP